MFGNDREAFVLGTFDSSFSSWSTEIAHRRTHICRGGGGNKETSHLDQGYGWQQFTSSFLPVLDGPWDERLAGPPPFLFLLPLSRNSASRAWCSFSENVGLVVLVTVIDRRENGQWGAGRGIFDSFPTVGLRSTEAMPQRSANRGLT